MIHPYSFMTRNTEVIPQDAKPSSLVRIRKPSWKVMEQAKRGEGNNLLTIQNMQTHRWSMVEVNIC